MIRKWLLPEMKLAVGKPEYKMIIESDLKITCVHNEIVMELMWGIQHLMHRLLPEEKAEVAKEDRLPMSQGLKMCLRRYGFDVKPEMVNDQIVETAGDLFECDAIEKLFSSYLRDVSLCIKDTSGINCENWGNLKLATALIVIFGPEEDDNDFREVLSEDEVSKLMDDARKCYGVLSMALSLRTYKKIRSAYRVRNEKKILLESLIKKAKEAFEAEQAQVCEKGKVHGESEQTPQEHVISASKPPYVYEHPLPKGLKRSWNSACEPNVLNKSTFCESLSLGETGSRRIASISEAQPSTSKAIVPYKPFPRVVLLDQNIDVDNLVGISAVPPPLTESIEQVEVLGDGKDEELVLAEFSEQAFSSCCAAELEH